MPRVIFDDENEPHRSIKDVQLPSREKLKEELVEENYNNESHLKQVEQGHNDPQNFASETEKTDVLLENNEIEIKKTAPPKPRKKITPGADQGIRVQKQEDSAFIPPKSVVTDVNMVNDDIRIDNNTKQYGGATDIPEKYEPRKGKGYIFAWGAIACVFLAAIYIFFIQSSSAQVNISIQPIQSNVNEMVTNVATTSKTVSGTGSASYPKSANNNGVAPEMVKTQTKATGVVTLYNTATTPQALITTTRVQDENGLVYRINNKVIIPAQKQTDAGPVPGSIEVQATADAFGEKYNKPKGQTEAFKVPGLKGTPQYDTTYAKSNSGFEGGFDGMRAKLSIEQIDTAKLEALNNLKNDIYQKAGTLLGNDFLFVNSNVEVSPSYVEGTSTITAVATATVVGYSKAGLEKIVGFPITSTNNASIIKKDDGTLELTGQVEVSAPIDQNKLKTALSGIRKTDAEGILRQFPSIKDGTITIKPFWKQSLPSSKSDITVSIK